MAITFPHQVNGQTADAFLINDMADAITGHDALLTDGAMVMRGNGNYLNTAATKATSASTTEIAVTDYTLANVEIPVGRIVEFVTRLRLQSTVAGDLAMIRLRQTNPAGPLAAEEKIPLPAAATPYERTLIFPWRSTSPTPTTWMVTLHRLSGTGTLTVTTGGTTLPGIIYARDVAADTRFTII